VHYTDPNTTNKTALVKTLNIYANLILNLNQQSPTVTAYMCVCVHITVDTCDTQYGTEQC